MFEKYSKLASNIEVVIEEFKNGERVFDQSFYDMSEKEFVGFLLSMEGKNIQDSLIVVTLHARWSGKFKENDRKFVLNNREVFYTSDFFNEVKPLLDTYVEETEDEENKNPF